MKHSVGKTLTAGATTTIFTVPMGYKAEVSLLFISNHSGSNKNVTAYWEHAHDTSHKIYIIDNLTLNSHGSGGVSYVQFSDASIVMQQGDKMVVTTEAGSNMSCIVTFDLRKESNIVAFDGE
jgi:hypothetical protein